MEGLQWGRPGPGGAYWRHSALTGQNFFDKMVSIVTEAILQLGDKGEAISASKSSIQRFVILGESGYYCFHI